jgi:hypothetical protein
MTSHGRSASGGAPSLRHYAEQHPSNPAENRSSQADAPHNPALSIIGLGLNRFAVVTRGKIRCHHLISLHS